MIDRIAHGTYLQAHQLGSYPFYICVMLSISLSCSPMLLSVLSNSDSVEHNGMGRHSATVSLSQLVILLKVHLVQYNFRSMMLTTIKVFLCRQHPLPPHHQHDQNLHPALLLPPLRDSEAFQEASIHHASSRCLVARLFTHPRNTPMPSSS